MKIDITRLYHTDEGQLDFDFMQDLSAENTTSLYFPQPLRAEGVVESKYGEITVDGYISGDVSAYCDRCGDNFIWGLDFDFTRRVSEEEDDEGLNVSAPGGRLDMPALVVEEVLVALPMKILCGACNS
jgi:uncharacterized metal-binding protein YceD (DUF177 family)